MTAPDQSNPTQPEKKAPVNTTQEERPGVAAPAATAADNAGHGDKPEEQASKNTASRKSGKFPFETLEWEELLEQLGNIVPQSKAPAHREYVNSYRDFLNRKFAATLNGTFVIPKVESFTNINNAIFFDLLLRSAQYSAVTEIIAPSTHSGRYDISETGIFFDAYKNAEKNEPLPFSQTEARDIALLAMHNSTLLPPGTMRITGNAEQKALILHEIKLLNAFLPKNARMIVENESQIDLSLLPKETAQPAGSLQADEARTQEELQTAPASTSSTEANALKPAMTSLQEAQESQVPQAPAEVQTAAEQAAPVEEAAPQAPAEVPKNDVIAGPEEAFIAVDDDDGQNLTHKEAIGGDLQRKILQDVLNNFSVREIQNHMNLAGKTEDGVRVYRASMNIEGAPKDHYTDVLFTLPDAGNRQIISITGTDFYKAYTSPDIKLREKDPLEKGFDNAAGAHAVQAGVEKSDRAPASGPADSGGSAPAARI